MKKRILLVLAIFITGILAACGNSSSKTGSSEDSMSLKYGLAGPATDPMGVISDKIAKDVKVSTEEKLNIEVFAGSQLGGEVEMVEQVKSGSIDFALVTAGALSNFVPDMAVLDMPFLFRDYEHAHKVFQGEVGEELTKKASESGLKVLGYMDYGMGHLANTKKEILKPEDVKGLKMRTLENDIFMDTFKALGADPVPIPFPELYTSMQQGVVDGTDPVDVVMTGGKLFEVAKYYSLVSLNYRTGVLVMNEEKFNSLDEKSQTALVDVLKENTDYYHETVYPEYEASAKKLIKDNGVKITETDEINRDEFIKAVEPVYEKHEKRFGDLVEKIKAVQ